MTRSKGTKRNLLVSLLCILLSISMLVSSTFAWFTDTVKNSGNIIQSGNLDLEMYWTDDPSGGTWYNVEEDAYNTIFSYDNWEPGYTDVKYIKIVNKGNLAFNYDLTIAPQGVVGKLAEVINVYFAINDDKLNLRSNLDQLACIGLLKNVMNGGATASGTLLPEGTTSLFHDSGEVIVTLAMTMITSAGNEYQGESSGDFTIKALATQAPYERDSFGSDYDSTAEMPIALTASKVTVPVTPVDGKVPAGGVNVTGATVGAYLPEGVKLEDGATEVTLAITPKDATDSGLAVVNEEVLIPLDVHIDGVAADNTVPIVIDLGAVLPKHLNMGNYYLAHVENGATVTMAQVADRSQLTAHNQFTYDSATGEVSVCMASFSEATMVYDPENHWQGNVDYSWFVNPDSLTSERRVYTISNADQLYGFAKLMGAMHTHDAEWKKLETDLDFTFHLNDSTTNKNTYLVDAWGRNIVKWGFDGHTIQLVNDINLNTGNIPMAEEKTRVFYPIGYYNNSEELLKNGTTPIIYDRTDGNPVGLEGVVSSVNGFRGTFNGNGHTISNFYQNTWDMFGDYNNGYSGTPNYYKDAMGLFGYLYGAEVRNLTVDHFSCDGEFTPTGVLAAYAAAATDNETVEGCEPEPKKGYDQGATTIAGISITNCNPRVYNTGNGGVIGIGGNSRDRYKGDEGGPASADKSYTSTTNCRIVFNGVTVDNTNKISALWGSWDVACGGIMGMFRGYSRVVLTNCSVAAQIDVFNDVCGNYQYYWYRYAGMMIGSLRGRNTTDAQGYTVPNMENIAAYGSTVHFGDWNNYYYCELVANSLASYTHDHQMSRLEEVQSVNVAEKTYVDLSGEEHTIPDSGRYHYVVVTGKHATENATCYHFVNGAQHLHDSMGTETDPDTGKTVLKEDKQHIYLPFNQLFQGDGWGVKHIPIYDDGKNYYDGITILDRTDYMSEIKFAPKYETAQNAPLVIGLSGDAAKPTTLTVADLFEAVEGVTIRSARVVITMDKLIQEGTNENASAAISVNTTNWTARTIKFTEAGTYQITIQDYEYCKPSYLYVQAVAANPPTECDHCDETITWQPYAPGKLAAGHYYLLGDVTANKTITVSGDLVIHLNGHNMTFPESEAFIVTGDGNTLSIMGTGNVDGYGSNESGVIHVTQGANLNLYGGTYGYVDVAEDADAVPAAAVIYAAEEGTNIMVTDAVKVVDDEVFLTSDAVMALNGTFTAQNFAKGIELQNFALLDATNMEVATSGVAVIPNGVFTKKIAASKIDAVINNHCFTVPSGYSAIQQQGSALYSQKNLLASINEARDLGAEIQEKNSYTAQQLTTCPMCDATNVTWEVLDLSKDESVGKYVQSGNAHVLLMNQGTKEDPAKVNNIIYAAQKEITMCVLVKGNNYVTGRFLLRPGNTMNVMGDGFVTSNGTHMDGTWGDLGLFTLVGPDLELNLYGGNYTYTGGYRRMGLSENPEYALINASDRKSTINIYQGAVIGDAEARTDDNYMISTYGTVNMYGGTIRNGLSDCDAAGGNVTVRHNGIFNMYGGTISGGSTIFRGGNILLLNYAAMNMGYPGLSYATYPAPVIEDGQAIHDINQYGEEHRNDLGHIAVTNGGGNVATQNSGGYITFNMYAGELRGGLVKPEKDGYHEYQGGGNLYMNGRYAVRANLYGGLITEGRACSGGNIFARNGAIVTVEDGMTISNGKGYYYKSGSTTEMVEGVAAAQSSGGNIDMFNYAELIVNGGIITSGEAMNGGNINVGHNAITDKPTATINGGTISNGCSNWGGNIRVWCGDLRINGGEIFGGTATGAHTASGNIGVSGYITEANIEKNINDRFTSILTIQGGVIDGGIKVFQYRYDKTDATTKEKIGDIWCPTPKVILAKEVTINKGTNGYGMVLNWADNPTEQKHVLADISGLTGGTIWIDQPDGHEGVFTSNLGTLAPETAATYFTAVNDAYTVAVQEGQLALVPVNAG